MIIVNTTFVLAQGITDQVLSWISDVYVKSAIHDGAIAERTLLTRVLTQDDSQATYALHVWFTDMDAATKWNEGYGNRLRNILAQKYGEQALTFHTYLEVT